MAGKKHIVQFERGNDNQVFAYINQTPAFPSRNWPGPAPRPGQIWQVIVVGKNEAGSALFIRPIKSRNARITGKGRSKPVNVTPHWKRKK